VRFANSLGMQADEWQANALRSNASRLLLNCHRQAGKSTIADVAAVHRALYTPKSLVLIVSPTQRQSGELLRLVVAFYRTLGKPIDPEAENALSLVLENGSRVISVPGSETNIRGYTADLIIVDEAARVSDDLYAAVSPMLAVSKGRLVAMSTPAGKRGWFYDASESERWERHTVRATECPRIPAEFLEEERATLGELAFRQEYLCEFVDAAGAAFSGDDISAIFGAAPERTKFEPVGPRPERPPLDEAQLELQRMNAMLNNRAQEHRRAQKKRLNACKHRWRVLPGGGPTYCVFCGKTEEDKQCSALA
jgi:hypothetical protein